MSAYKEVKVNFKKQYQHILVSALQELGYTVEVSEKAKQLFGFHGDARQQVANVIIRREQLGSASNDVGWQWKQDGSCVAHISDYDGKRVFGKAVQNKLACKYAELFIKESAAKNGWQLSEFVEEKGAVTVYAIAY